MVTKLLYLSLMVKKFCLGKINYALNILNLPIEKHACVLSLRNMV